MDSMDLMDPNREALHAPRAVGVKQRADGLPAPGPPPAPGGSEISCRPMSPIAQRFGAVCRVRFSPLRLLAAPLLAVAIGGCASMTARQLEEEHVAFNTAVAEAMDRQMLLNIVRLWHSEPTQWMQVASINTSVEYSVGIAGDAAFSSGQTRGGVAANGRYSYRPTLTFNPLEGEQLARELMSPVQVESLVNLVSAGWPVSWLFFLVVDRCEDIGSFDVSERFGVVAGDERFGRLLDLCDELERRQLMSLMLSQIPVVWNAEPIAPEAVSIGAIASARSDHCRYVRREDGRYDYMSVEIAPVFQMYPALEDKPLGKELLALLRLDEEPNAYRLVTVDSPLIANTTVSVQTRSLMSVLRLLSFGVSDGAASTVLPASDGPGSIYLGLARSDGEDAQIKDEVSRFFRVHRSASRPEKAAIEVLQEGSWYWIAADDRLSKQLFSLVRDLYDLQVKSQPGGRPVLTIPVG